MGKGGTEPESASRDIANLFEEYKTKSDMADRAKLLNALKASRN